MGDARENASYVLFLGIFGGLVANKSLVNLATPKVYQRVFLCLVVTFDLCRSMQSMASWNANKPALGPSTNTMQQRSFHAATTGWVSLRSSLSQKHQMGVPSPERVPTSSNQETRHFRGTAWHLSLTSIVLVVNEQVRQLNQECNLRLTQEEF